MGLTERLLLRYMFHDVASINRNPQDTPLLPSKASTRFTRNATWSPSKLGTSTWRWSLMACTLGSKNCRSRIPPSAFNSACAVRSFKASGDRFIAADPHHRESPTTMQCRSRYLHPLLQGSAVPYSSLLYKRQLCKQQTVRWADSIRIGLRSHTWGWFCKTINYWDVFPGESSFYLVSEIVLSVSSRYTPLPENVFWYY